MNSTTSIAIFVAGLIGLAALITTAAISSNNARHTRTLHELHIACLTGGGAWVEGACHR